MSTRTQIRLAQLGLGPAWVPRSIAQAGQGELDPVPTPAAITTAAAGQAQDAGGQDTGGEILRVPQQTHAIDDAKADSSAESIASMDWEALEATIRGCTRCGLCEGRKHAVPGTGDRAARWLFVGEGPGRNEDLQGEPFVGPAGKLLDNMMRALGLARGENTYIANIVKCRPVGADGRDRPPTADEVAACMPYLQRQVALIRPDVIVALGKTAAVSLLGLPDDTSLASLRGRPRDYAGIPLVITYHPAYLLRRPVDKAKTWRDLCVARSLIDGR